MFELYEGILMPASSVISRVILSVSPCRSGTTALLRVFSGAGIESYFQELKNLLRWKLHGQKFHWFFPHTEVSTIFMKETLGPFTEAEARFDPLEVLLKAGVPPTKLHLLTYGRDPIHTWTSWNHWWGTRTNVNHLISSYQTTERIRTQACLSGIASTTLVYEMFRDFDVTTIMQRLFARLEIPFASNAVSNWSDLPAMDSVVSNISDFKEPVEFSTPHIHDEIDQASGFIYYPPLNDRLECLRPEDVEAIRKSRLAHIYHTWRQLCENDLEVDPSVKTKNGLS